MRSVFRAVLVWALLGGVPTGGLARSSGGSPPDATVFDAAIPGTGAVVTVAEGPREPRSIGSYALRLYVPHDPAWPYDAFAFGLVRVRDGGVEELLFDDVDHDGANEVIVVLRSAGSGGYISADAFAIRGRRLVLVAEVAGLSRTANPVPALRRVVHAPAP